MGTPYSEINDLFLMEVKDYKINSLFIQSTPLFSNYLKGFLINAIPNFMNCVNDLEDRDDSLETFNVSLTSLEKSILKDLMVYEWFLKEVQDVTQFNLTLSDTDFKHFSEAQNLREKTEWLDRIRERYEQKMVNYGMKNIPWLDWQGGVYG